MYLIELIIVLIFTALVVQWILRQDFPHHWLRQQQRRQRAKMQQMHQQHRPSFPIYFQIAIYTITGFQI